MTDRQDENVLSTDLHQHEEERDSKYEVCSCCGIKTHILKKTNIDKRTGYIEGFGQLCFSCLDIYHQ